MAETDVCCAQWSSGFRWNCQQSDDAACHCSSRTRTHGKFSVEIDGVDAAAALVHAVHEFRVNRFFM